MRGKISPSCIIATMARRSHDFPGLGCDTMVALPAATRDGFTIFAKNSDRPANECQPLVQVKGRRHPPASEVRCQYLSIPQVRHTYGFVGSQPYWLWGLEHGVNEYRVAIGNEAVYTRDPLPATGLLGMDLVRLGLERAETAFRAVEVMTGLLETYGQGGSALPGTAVGYHNSFLIADPADAWVLEASGWRWAARRVPQVGSISNHIAIHDDWDLASADLESHAVERGWWDTGRGRLAFDSAYRETETVPARMSEGRLARSRCLLETNAGRLTERDFMDFLRDHGDGPAPLPEHRDPESPDFFTLCFHLDPLVSTTASIVARLRVKPDGWPDLWACLGSPCTGVFLPIYLDADLPPALSAGGTEPSRDSPWWRFKALRDAALSPEANPPLAEAGPRNSLVRLQACWRAWEDQLLREVEDLAQEVVALEASGQAAAARQVKSRFQARAAEGTLRRLVELGY